LGQLSPMMRQYLDIKEKNKDCILFFRLGDFYEMFFDDAKLVSEELEIVLTGRDCGQEERAPMCGVPYHSCESYIARLVEKGYKIAICEQVEDPATAKGLVKRDIVRVITPGTVTEESMLDESKNNYLCAVCFSDTSAGLCFTDVSTGLMNVTELSGDNLEARVCDEIGRFSPKEILSVGNLETHPILREYTTERIGAMYSPLSAEDFATEHCENLICEHFKVNSSESLGLSKASPAVLVTGATLGYLYRTRFSHVSAITKLNFYSQSQYMKLDVSAIRNLELFETMRGKSKKGSLLGVLDKTKTAMGKRLIRGWLEQPLLNVAEITGRHNAVDELVSNFLMLGELTEYLTGIKDMERLMSRIVYGTASGKELLGLAEAAAHFPAIKEVLSSANSRLLRDINSRLDTLEDIKALIDESINPEAPAIVREGGIIKEGYNSEVDELRLIIENGAEYISAIESRERERTGIKNLRVRYNKVFGYYIEVSNSYLDRVPEDYVRRQTLTNGERFITDELKTLEGKILGAKDRVKTLEFNIFDEIRKTVAAELLRVQTTASAVAALDVLCSFSNVANANSYCCPKINTDGVLSITGGRHPVVEQVIKTPFVSNDTLLDCGDNRCALITGPNMAGKSTYMRQVAIITLMAQIGSFVPAQMANIGIVDAIFTRVGASDDLSMGQSTFMVEMSEVAYILKNATRKSLIIFDEIGRGTATFDGMSIARAVLEYVADTRRIGAKTLFATHYHELIQLENEIKGIKNYNIAVKKRGDDITFLRRIVRGGADDSYGIEVAALSGIPERVITRAKAVLGEIINNGVTVSRENIKEDAFLPLEMQSAGEILRDLKAVDVNTLTPIECMSMLHDLADKAKRL